jgi:quercetin dioxygenase-like cupin family protein
VRIMTLGTALLTATTLALSASAQNTPTAPAVTRTIVAATKLPSVVETPLYFKAMRVTLQPGGKSSLSAANGILYQLSGSTEISLVGENKMLGVGEALFVAAGKTASLSAGSGAPSILLYFILAPAAELDRPTATASATVTALYRYDGANSRLEARRLRPEPNPRYISARDAVQPAAPSLGSSALLHRLGNGRQHGRRHDEDKGP